MVIFELYWQDWVKKLVLLTVLNLLCKCIRLFFHGDFNPAFTSPCSPKTKFKGFLRFLLLNLCFMSGEKMYNVMNNSVYYKFVLSLNFIRNIFHYCHKIHFFFILKQNSILKHLISLILFGKHCTNFDTHELSFFLGFQRRSWQQSH